MTSLSYIVPPLSASENSTEEFIAYEAAIQQRLARLEEDARAFVLANEGAIRGLAEFLMIEQKMSGDRVREVLVGLA